jgi:hypothetical protein
LRASFLNCLDHLNFGYSNLFRLPAWSRFGEGRDFACLPQGGISCFGFGCGYAVL